MSIVVVASLLVLEAERSEKKRGAKRILSQLRLSVTALCHMLHVRSLNEYHTQLVCR